jgi:hypothetical protein
MGSGAAKLQHAAIDPLSTHPIEYKAFVSLVKLVGIELEHR